MLPPSRSWFCNTASPSRGEPHGEVDLFVRTTTLEGARTRCVLERSARTLAFPSEIAPAVRVSDVFVENALAAALGAWAAGVPAADIAHVLAELKLPDGRFDIIAERPYVVVDYAHTPDALTRTITAARGPGTRPRAPRLRRGRRSRYAQAPPDGACSVCRGRRLR